MKKRIILTDCDGVLCDWEYSFDVWMQQHGFNKVDVLKYSIGKRYNIDEEQAYKLIKIFNESAHMGFLPPLRDAMYYVKRLHEEHGYVFHCITSLTKDENACELRKMNLQKLFGKTAFEKFIFLDTGADKSKALEPYRDSGLWWVEDKYTNYTTGLDMGLKGLLMMHGHNIKFNPATGQFVKNWKEIYDIIVNEENIF